MTSANCTECCSRKDNVKKSMAILEDVQNNYKNKLRQLNYFGTKKKVIQLKFEIFQDWIKYLQEENKLLAQLVVDLEDDVIKDVQSLKKASAESSPEISQRSDNSEIKLDNARNIEIQKYKSEVKNLLMFLKAIREDALENVNLSFYFVRREDLYGTPPVKYTTKDEVLVNNLKEERDHFETKNEELQKELLKKNMQIQQQEERILQLEQKLEQQEKEHKEELLKRKSFDRLLTVKQSNVWEASKEVTNNMIQIWDKLVDTKICDDKSSNCHVVMDKNDNALDALQQAVNQITKELQIQGSISKQTQGDALLFIVFDKNKNTL